MRWLPLLASLSLVAGTSGLWGAPSPLDLPYPDGGAGRLVQTGNVPQAVALGDLDRDGDLDAVVANAFDDAIVLLRGDGAGGLMAEPGLNVGPTPGPPPGVANDLPRDVAIADVDGDWMLDVVVVNSGRPSGPAVAPSVAVLRGRPDGNLTPPVFYPLGAGAAESATLALGQIDEDEPLDLVVGHRGSRGISVLRGRRNGRFDSAQVTSLTTPGPAVTGLAVADLDLDGRGDVIVANERDIQILRGNGNGTFQPAVTLVTAGTGAAIGDIALTDLNGDGAFDLVFIDASQARISALMGIEANGTFASRIDTPTPGLAIPTALAVEDFTLDGLLDVAMTSWGAPANEQISVHRGNGEGGFLPAPALSPAGRQPVDLVAGHLTSEGAPDILTANQGEGGGDDVTVVLGAATRPPGPSLLLGEQRDIAAQAGPAVAVAPGLGIDPANGDRWLCDPLRRRIVRLSATGTRLGEIDTGAFGCFDPQDVAIHRVSGNLWIAGGSAQAIWQITPLGQVLGTIPTGPLTGIALDEDSGRLYVTVEANTALFALSLAGALLDSYDLPDPVTDLAFEPDTGHLLATRAGEDRVLVLALDEADGEADIIDQIDLHDAAPILGRSNPIAVGHRGGPAPIVVTTDTGAIAALAEPEPGEWRAASIFAHDTGLRLGGLAASSEAAVFAADRGLRGEVLGVDEALSLFRRLPFNGDMGMELRRWAAVAVAGNEIVCLEEREPEIRVFSAQGTPVRSIHVTAMLHRRPGAVAFHPPRGTLFVLGDRRLVELSLAGALLNTYPIDATLAEASLSFDPASGHLIALAAQHRRFVRIAAGTGQVVSRRSLAGDLPPALSPRGLALRANSGQWVVSTSAPSVLVEATLMPGAMASGLMLR